MSFWYNTATGQVETDENRSQAQDVMGPYDTREEAAGALQSARARTEQWDREDREGASKGSASIDKHDNYDYPYGSPSSRTRRSRTA